MLISSLTLGFLIGMQHAIQADHVAAVASIAAGKRGVRSIVRQGVVWGIGHTVTLLIVGGVCLFMAKSVPDSAANLLESVVGVMLMGLGGHLLYRVWRDRVHFHSHRHAPTDVHIHAHSHRGDAQPHSRSAHQHEHPSGLPWRTFVVGLVHGMAGSPALIVLTAATLESPWWGVAYILIFGLGSVAGMALLSCIIAVPLTLTASALTVANRALQVVVGMATAAIGLHILVERAPSLLAVI